ncbi:hypothetical protein TNCV_3791021 [Trichonephila clavipes]|nr:hypothetical protein TNCV_3791021 [Trichonephila clavipes]
MFRMLFGHVFKKLLVHCPEEREYYKSQWNVFWTIFIPEENRPSRSPAIPIKQWRTADNRIFCLYWSRGCTTSRAESMRCNHPSLCSGHDEIM